MPRFASVNNPGDFVWVEAAADRHEHETRELGAAVAGDLPAERAGLHRSPVHHLSNDSGKPSA